MTVRRDPDLNQQYGVNHIEQSLHSHVLFCTYREGFEQTGEEATLEDDGFQG